MKYPVVIVEIDTIQVRISNSVSVISNRGTYDGAEWTEAYIEIASSAIIETFEVGDFVVKIQEAKRVCEALDIMIAQNWRKVGFPESFPESIEV